MRRSRRKIWGWGYEGEGLDDAQRAALAAALAKRHGVAELKPHRAAPQVADVELPAPRLEPPAALADRFTAEPAERLLHSYGKSYPDAVRALRGEFPHPPDLVAYPRDENDVVAILDWASDRDAAVVPFGGGSSVCGGVEPAVGDSYAGTISLDLQELDQLLEVDRASRAARFQAGVRGPALEAALKPHGLTLRHFPQSFEHSTLGGWIATRSGGHFATLYTHIDDLVESLRVRDAGGRPRDAPPARLGRRPQPRPHVHRLRGHRWA
jgi:alkyldihydroxyacetonephosphate synthase